MCFGPVAIEEGDEVREGTVWDGLCLGVWDVWKNKWISENHSRSSCSSGSLVGFAVILWWLLGSTYECWEYSRVQ